MQNGADCIQCETSLEKTSTTSTLLIQRNSVAGDGKDSTCAEDIKIRSLV